MRLVIPLVLLVSHCYFYALVHTLETAGEHERKSAARECIKNGNAHHFLDYSLVSGAPPRLRELLGAHIFKVFFL